MTENLTQYWVYDGEDNIVARWAEKEQTELCDREIDEKGTE